MNKFMIKLIKEYQDLKPEDRRKWCKYHPTCSNYAIGVYQKFNFFKATLLAIWRILRCNPFSKGGYDPVPLTKKEKREFENSLKESELKNSLKESSNLTPQVDEEVDD